MKKVINFPVVKTAPVKMQKLCTSDIEYIQQAVLDSAALDVHIICCPGQDIPEALQERMTEAKSLHEVAVGELLAWAKATDPVSYEKYLHMSVDALRHAPSSGEVNH